MIPERSTLLRRLLAIALPMVVSQASDSIMMFVDRLFLSRLGEAYLSASMSGGLTQFMVSSLFIGTIGYTNAVVAQLYGAKHERIAEATVQGMILALICYPIILGVSPLARYLFVVAGQSDLQVALGYRYFQVLIFGSLFLVLRFAMSGFFLGIGRTRVVMIANLVGMLVNIPANYVLIYGKMGFPALGLTGAALGTIVGSFTMCVILVIFYLRPANRREFATHRGFRFELGNHEDPGPIRGAGGVRDVSERDRLQSLRAVHALLRHRGGRGGDHHLQLGHRRLYPDAGYEIRHHRPGRAVRRRQGLRHREEGRLPVPVGCLDLFRHHGRHLRYRHRTLVGTFASGFGPEGPAIARLATTLLRLAALYILADSAQLVFAGALRGAGDTRWVMYISVGLHWAFSHPGDPSDPGAPGLPRGRLDRVHRVRYVSGGGHVPALQQRTLAGNPDDRMITIEPRAMRSSATAPARPWRRTAP